MRPINRTFAPLQAVVDELARCGLEHAVTSPGSRNAPIVLTLAADERIRALSVLDERSAGFAAIGLAKTTGRPVAVACTSGTAAANLLPAVIEAHEARVPLIVLTADRPPELRDTGAGQAIDQLKLYGSAVKWFVEVGSHEPGRQTAVHHRALACRAYATAAGGRPGPVHLNFPLREPLAPIHEELDAGEWSGRDDGRPWVEVREAARAPDAATVARLSGEVAATPRGAIVCGPTTEELADQVGRLAALTGWPALAEPTSGMRWGPHDRSAVIAHYDALLRSARFAESHVPDVVFRVGDAPTSKPLRAWLGSARQIVLDPHATWHEPTRSAETIAAASAAATCAALATELDGRGGKADDGWIASWRSADAAVPGALAAAPDPSEAKAYVAIAPDLRDGDVVWVASSMPIRDVETFLPQGSARVRFLANRGANGIDGTASSAMGAARAASGRAYLVTGELALLHDLGGLLAARRHGIELTIVCVQNGGGGIFDFLPVAEAADAAAFEEHVATPSGVDLAEVASLAGLPHHVADTPEEVRAAAREPGLVEVRTNRSANVTDHRAVFERVDAAIG